MGNIIKAYRYRIVDNSAFEMPMPLKFTIWKADAPIAEYTISEDEQVTYRIITRYKELMITTTHRPLDISDIYYLFSCRVFQDRTPFTAPILERMGLEKYNVYNILCRTHGVSPYDDYWIRFDGEKLDFDEAVEEFDKYLIGPEVQPVPVVSYPNGALVGKPKAQDPAVSAILNQHRVDFDSIAASSASAADTAPSAHITPAAVVPEESYEPEREIENNKMSEADIEKLLQSCGLTNDEPDTSANSEKSPEVEPESRSQVEASGGTLSQEEIEKMLAEASAPSPAPEPSEPSGGKMSQEDIEKLLAANAAPLEAEPAPEPAPEAPASSGGKMSQEDIEKLLAANAAPIEAEPAPEHAPETPASSGGKMSQEDIEKLLAANAAPLEAEPAPEPAPEAPASSGGKMSQEDIEKLLAANAAPLEAEPAPEPAPEATASSGGKMSQEDIEALLNSMQEEANK